jgi:sec-independent protein translocase protein TatB
MIDIGLSKIIIIGVVALIVIGPEKLPATAKAIGIIWSRLQRYIFKLKQEVNQHISIDEINSFKAQAMQASSSIQSGLNNIHQDLSLSTSYNINNTNDINATDFNLQTNVHSKLSDDDIYNADKYDYSPKFCNGRYSWRLKKLNMPLWYKHKNGIRGRVQGGSARMKRFRYQKSNTKKHFWF